MDVYAALAVGVMAIVTLLLRALPFFVFRNKSVPKYVDYLGKYLPFSVMALLVVYCLKGVEVLSGNHGIPELLAVLAVVALHVWKKNTVISVIAGTAIYMLLIRIM